MNAKPTLRLLLPQSKPTIPTNQQRSPSSNNISIVPLLFSRFTHNHHHNLAGNSTHNNHNTQTTIIKPYQTHNPKAKKDSEDLRLPKVKVIAEPCSYNSIIEI
ncbi:hypothetical protein ACB092_08G093500 [Castanea dentata]